VRLWRSPPGRATAEPADLATLWPAPLPLSGLPVPAVRHLVWPGSGAARAGTPAALGTDAPGGRHRFDLSWNYQVGAVLLARVLPGAAVSARTVARVTKWSAAARQAAEDRAAQACLVALSAPAGSVSAPGLPPFAQPTGAYLGLAGILARGREQKSWLEIQVTSWGVTGASYPTTSTGGGRSRSEVNP
jgi:hypothetical protein